MPERRDFLFFSDKNRIGELSNLGSLVDEGIEPFNLILKTKSSFKVKYPLRAVMKQLLHDTLPLMKGRPVSLASTATH